MKAALAATNAAPARPPGDWLAWMRRWWGGQDAAWLALGRRTHTLDWWAGA